MVLYLYACMRACVCVCVFRGGAGVCGLSVYLRGGTPHRPQQFQA